MKKYILTLVGVAVLTATYAAPRAISMPGLTQSISLGDSVNLNQYTGKYKFEGLPFEFVTIGVKDGKLTIDTGSENGVLSPLQDADSFDAAGRATLLFTRDADKKVTGLTLKAAGNDYPGKKES